MLLKSPGKVLEKSLNKRLSNLYEPCSINDVISKALDDISISDLEFKTISQEIRKYHTLKDKLRKSFRLKKDNVSQTPPIDRDQIYKEIQEEIRLRFRLSLQKKHFNIHINYN